MNKNNKIYLLVLLSIIIIISAPFIGMVNLDYNNLFTTNSTDNFILFNTRIPRVLAGFLAGGVLAVSGLVFQAVFKNPLATPFTLGVAGGASFGAALFIYIGVNNAVLFYFGITFASMIGALLIILLVYLLSIFTKKLYGNTLLLSGVAVSFFTSALIMFMQYFSNAENSYKITRYMIGTLTNISLENALLLIPFVAVAFIIIYSYHKELDIISTGSHIAESRGINVTKTITILYFTVSLIVATVTAVTGPIGFVGMMVPHIIRMIISCQNKILIPTAFISGGAFLVLCDTFARVVVAPVELPVAIITSLLGAPFFIFLIIKGNKY